MINIDPDPFAEKGYTVLEDPKSTYDGFYGRGYIVRETASGHPVFTAKNMRELNHWFASAPDLSKPTE